MSMAAIERAATEVRIGNHGVPLAYINTTNERLVTTALNKFKEGLFDHKGVQRFFNVQGRPVIMDSLRVSSGAIWAGLKYPRMDDDRIDAFMENVMRRGCLWLGADIEFEDGRPLSASTLAREMAFIEAQAVGEGMISIRFIMLYYWDRDNHRRETIYKISDYEPSKQS